MTAINIRTKLIAEIEEAVTKALNEPCPTSEKQALADRIAGRTFTREEKERLAIDSLKEGFIARHKLLQNSVVGSDVCQYLNSSSRMTPINRVNSGTLLAVKDGGVWKYPIWQFDPEGNDCVVNGLVETIAVLNMSNIAKISWLTTPNSRFETKTPLEMLKSGKIEEVVNEAKGIGVS